MNTSGTTPSCCCNNNAQEPKTEGTLVKIKKTSRSLPSILTSVLIAFFPKCPMCWAVYMSTLGSFGLVQLPYMPWLLPVLLLFFAIHLFMLYRKIPQKGYLPFLMSLGGAIVILTCRSFLPQEKWLLITGMILIISGSLLNSFSGKIRIHSTYLKNNLNNQSYDKS
ncbi:MAG: hypothetical protein WC756_05125 [Taibaiella sp.]